MRIFYAAYNRPTGELAESNIWHYNLYLPLCDLGHEVIQFDYDLNPHFAHVRLDDPAHRQFNEINRPRLETELLRQISEAHRCQPIDIFFSYFYSSFVWPEVIHEIRQMGIVTVNWYCNASYQFNLVEDIAPAYDYCLVPEKFRLIDYRRIGANPIYCQEAANPNIYKPYHLPMAYDVTFVGAAYGERPALVRYLLGKKIDIHVWGAGWKSLYPPKSWWQRGKGVAGRIKRILLRKHRGQPRVSPRRCHGPLSDEEMIKMYSQSKISLGFSVVGETHRKDQPIKQIRLRDFEAPMSGAFYMVGYMEELEEFFVPDKEVVYYYDRADLAEKVKYYLSNDTERETIRNAGYKRAVNEHTWQRRFQQVFKQMGLCT